MPPSVFIIAQIKKIVEEVQNYKNIKLKNDINDLITTLKEKKFSSEDKNRLQDEYANSIKSQLEGILAEIKGNKILENSKVFCQHAA